MKLATQENAENLWLLPIIEKINILLKGCDGFIQLGDRIQICPHHEQQIVEGYPGNLSSENGYAITKHPVTNTDGYGPFHLILLNHQLCRAHSLDQEEVFAVIMHELGHILNAPELEEVPTVLSVLAKGGVFDKNEVSVIKNRNALKKEYYADNFAAKFGYGKSVISSLEKYSKSSEAQNQEIADFRIEVLNKPFVETVGTPILFN